MSTALSPQDRVRLEALFDRAADLPRTEHAAFLERECGSSGAVRDELARLLDGLVGEDILDRLQVAAPLDAGTRIGPYELHERVGEGGMGEVYSARQFEPVDRRVALKIIKLGMDSAQVLARFQAERQALARMTHPNVAQIFDGGTTEAGRPYFVMEFVAGESITEHCNRQKLSTRERLELFLGVCEGVQHAHQKGIIHRDLKPSNLLVTLQDGSAVPKVIDFGVARATTGTLAERTLHTMLGQIVGTLDYMSPEQADPTGLDIDTRSDIYSLGVVLYQLLCGLLPFDHSLEPDRPLSELQKAIREKNPPTPSTRLRRRTGTATAIAPLHATDGRSLVRQLCGDLDWICLKALEKDPSRRYQSVSELAEDVRRHLTDQPVLAGRPGTLYLGGKFVRRHRVAVMASCLVSLSLVVTLIVSLTFGSREAGQRRMLERARYNEDVSQASEALNRGNFSAARKWHDQAPELLRNWEWNHLEQRWPQELGQVTIPDVALAAYLDETRILVVDFSSGVHVWNALTGEKTDGPPSQESSARVWPSGSRPLALCADGRRLLTYSEGSLALGDALGTDPPVAISFRGRVAKSRPRTSAVSADGTRAAVATEANEVILIEPGEESRVLPTDEPVTEVLSLAFSQDSRRLAVTRESGMLLFDLDELALLGKWSPQYGATAVSADGLTVVGESSGRNGSGAGMYVGDVSSRYMLPLLARTEYEVSGFDGCRDATFSQDGGLLALVFDGVTSLLVLSPAPRTEAAPAVRARYVGSVPHTVDNRVAFSPSGASVMIVGKDTVGLWRVPSVDAARVCAGHTSFVYSVAFSPDGATLASGSWDGSVRFWESASGELIADVPLRGIGSGAHSQVNAVAFSPDGRQLARMTGGKLDVLDVARGHVLKRLTHDAGSAVAYSPDGAFLVGDTRGRTHVWNARTLEELPGHYGDVVGRPAFAFDSTETRLAVGSSTGMVWLLDPSSGAVLAQVQGPTNSTFYPGANALAFAPGGDRLVVGWGVSTVSIHDVPSLARVRELHDHALEVLAVAFSPDGSRIASGGRDDVLRLWDAETGDLLLKLEGHSEYIKSIAFSPDGSQIATGSGDHSVRIWEAADAASRWREIQEVELLRPSAERLVAELYAELEDPAAVVARLEEDAGLSPRQRPLALGAVLRREVSAQDAAAAAMPR